ncbi:MAG: hypothetical protein AAFN92_23445, partial [Bacteroidota bacterium]
MVIRSPLLLFALLSVACTCVRAQGSPLPTNDPDYEFIRRLSIRYGYAGFERPATDLSLRPVNRAGLVRLAKTYQQRYGNEMSAVDKYRLQRFFDDHNEWLALEPFTTEEDADRAAFFL